MGTRAALPIPATMLPAGPQNQFDWLGLGDELAGLSQRNLQRGQPSAMAWWQRKQIAGPATIAQGVPFYLQSRPYDRGADAYSPKFGVLNINPIGAGVVTPYRLPTIAGPGARYAFGAIFFDVQAVPTTMRASPTIPTETLAALLATSHVGAAYGTTG